MRILKAFLPLAAVCSLAAQDVAPRIAIFMPERLIQNTVRGRKIFVELEVTSKNLNDKIKAKEEEGTKLQAQLQSPSLSDSGKETLQKQLRDLDFEYKKMQEDAQAEFKKVQAKVFGQFQTEVGPIVEAVAKEMKLQLVLQYQQGMVAYGEEVWMTAFTNEVAKRYDAKFEAGAPGVDKPAAEKPAKATKAAPKK